MRTRRDQVRTITVALLVLGACTRAPHGSGVPHATPSASASSSPIVTQTRHPVIPWISAAPPAGPPTPSQEGIRRCLATDLAGSYLNSGAAAGNDSNTLAIRDAAPTPCYVKGRPQLQLITTDGRAFPWSSGTTFFPDQGAVEVLLTPRTPIPMLGTGIVAGQASLLYTYADCDLNDHIARVVIRFGDHQTSVRINGQGVPTGLPACNGRTKQIGPVQTSVNNFEPPEVPDSPIQDTTISITAPTRATAGSRLHYQLSIGNGGPTAIKLPSPCPGYKQSLGNARVGASSSYALNCSGDIIGAGDYEEFEMVLAVPKDFHGSMILTWEALPSSLGITAQAFVTVS